MSLPICVTAATVATGLAQPEDDDEGDYTGQDDEDEQEEEGQHQQLQMGWADDFE
jgi:hypothetical protein